MPERHDRFAAARQTQFQFYAVGRLASATAMTLINATIAYQVFRISDSAFQLGPLRLTLLALDATTAIKEAADMEKGAAGAVERPMNRTGEAIGLGQGISARPARIEQLLFAPRPIIRVAIGPARHSTSRPRAIWM